MRTEIDKKLALAGAVEALEIRALMSSGVLPSASQAAGGIVARPAGNTGTGFFVANGNVFDATGHQFIIKGFNHTTQFGDSDKNLAAIPEFAKTGANAVRAVMGTFGVAASPAQRQSVVAQYLAEGIVPIVEDQSATNSQSVGDLQAVTNNWLQAGNVSWLKSNERNVILNIANEWGPATATYRDAYISMISQLRNAGINAMIMVDAGGSGQNLNSITQFAKDIENADPQHNVLFSLHMYNFWTTGGKTATNSAPAGSPWDMATQLSAIQQSGIPLVIGEYSMTDGSSVPYDTRTAMGVFKQLGLGSLAWSWNQNGNHIHDMMAQTAGWQYDNDSDLSAFGNLVVNDPAVGLKSTAIPAASLRPATLNGTLTLNGVAVNGATVYIDDNNNSIRDAGELSTATGPAGAFSFTNLPQGIEHLRVIKSLRIPLGAQPITVDLPAGSTVNVAMTALKSTTNTASIRGTVFTDTGHDGYLSAGETGAAGLTLFIDLDSDGIPDNSDPVAVTDQDGSFSFTGLAAGTYTVKPVLASDTVQTTAALTKTLAAGEQAGGTLIGITTPPALGAIGGSLFKDANLSGTQDAGENGYAFRTVFLDLNTNGVQDSGEPAALSEGDGSYLFTRLAPGTYSIRKTVGDGLLVTTPQPTGTVAAFQVTTVDPIGVMTQPGNLSGVVFNDADSNTRFDTSETVAAGTTVFVDANHNNAFDAGELTTTTGDDGRFTFTSLPVGQYFIGAVAPDGLGMTTGDAGWYLNSAQTYNGLKIGIGLVSAVTPPTPPPTPASDAVISGVYYSDDNKNQVRDPGEAGVGQATVFLDTNSNNLLDAGELTAVTADDGTFAFNGLAAGTYHLRSIPPSGLTVGTPLMDAYLTQSQNFNVANVGVVPAAPLPATIAYEAEAAALNGVYNATTHIGYTGNGFADFGNQGTSATFTVTRSRAGTAALQFRYANAGGSARPATVFVNGVEVGTLGGTVTANWDTWKVDTVNATLINGTNTIVLVAGANTGANYDSMTVVDTTAATTAGTAPATASIGGMLFTDDDGDGKLNGSNAPASGGTVFIDTNSNGVLDAGETSAAVAAGGGWFFSGLAAGTYHVRSVVTATQRISSTSVDLALTDGQAATGQLIGIAPVSTTPTTTSYAINAGGSASGTFLADSSYSGGSTYKTTNTINTSAVTTAAPQAVYQTERFGNFTYTLANLVAGQVYNVQLDFSENYLSAAGLRLFNVTGNGAAWLTGFDIFSAAGGKYRAITRTFQATADSSGKVTVGFVSVKDNAKINGIEIAPAA